MAVDEMDQMKEDVKPAIISKLEEFHSLGYESVTEDELWEFILHQSKKKKLQGRLYEVVNCILTLKIHDFMNWLTLEAYKKDAELYRGQP
ncbi:post-transcriptional regulator [Fictibacillus sp. Mic-4]|uniref:post-transcriptional regulator n=1 Tax=Fictibacillus TaxID=1329200 RepID=UPI000409D594|nr:post-transcriptional regulator [Fictibacillus gelatini]